MMTVSMMALPDGSARTDGVMASPDHPTFAIAVDRLVHAHLQDLYQHVRCLYPLADVDDVVDDVFTTAARQGHRPGPATRWQLFRLARSAVRLRFPSTRWARQNASAVVLSLHQTAGVLDDWYTWTDVDALLRAFTSCPLVEQEVLALIAYLDDLDADRLAVILAISPDAADSLLQQSTASFRAACAAPPDGSDG